MGYQMSPCVAVMRFYLTYFKITIRIQIIPFLMMQILVCSWVLLIGLFVRISQIFYSEAIKILIPILYYNRYLVLL